MSKGSVSGACGERTYPQSKRRLQSLFIASAIVFLRCRFERRVYTDFACLKATLSASWRCGYTRARSEGPGKVGRCCDCCLWARYGWHVRWRGETGIIVSCPFAERLGETRGNDRRRGILVVLARLVPRECCRKSGFVLLSTINMSRYRNAFLD
jgi:hypothetical protein